VKKEKEALEVGMVESEALIRTRDREAKQMMERVELLEHIIQQQQVAAATGVTAPAIHLPPREIGFGGSTVSGAHPRIMKGGAVQEEDGVEYTPAEDAILEAEAELQAAMLGDDPERLKAAITAASEAVERERAKGSHVVVKQHMIMPADQSKSKSRQSTKLNPLASDMETDEEKAFKKFGSMFDDRHIDLQHKGFEALSVSVDELWAVASKVPKPDWVKFLKMQMPIPTGEDGGALVFGPDEAEGMPWYAEALALRDAKGSLSSIVVKASEMIEKPDGMAENKDPALVIGDAPQPKPDTSVDALMGMQSIVDPAEFYNVEVSDELKAANAAAVDVE